MVGIPLWEHVAVTQRGGITELRFHTDDGPLVWGALPHREITDAFRWVGSERDTKVVILIGTGDTYCTNIDVTGFADMAWDEVWWEGRRMLTYLNDIDVPVVSAVNGPATIHSELMVMGDIVIAAEHAEFADRAHFAVRDTVPGDGVAVVWGELLGRTRTNHFMMTGQAIGALEAQRLGVVNEIVKREELSTRVWELAEDFARRSLPILRYTKAALSVGFRRDFQERISLGLGVQGCGHWSRGGIQPAKYSTGSE
jgi:enoyl-CoA hydratase/carnithine racemase